MFLYSTVQYSYMFNRISILRPRHPAYYLIGIFESISKQLLTLYKFISIVIVSSYCYPQYSKSLFLSLGCHVLAR